VYFLFELFSREELESKQITDDNVANVIDALQIVKQEQQRLIELLNNEEQQINDELKDCKSIRCRIRTNCRRMTFVDQ
jgi:flagellar biosynthesis regulator FlaF